MGIKEDFTDFVGKVNTATNAIAASLTTIQGLLTNISQDPATPPDIAAAVADAAAKLQASVDKASAIAAGDQPVIPPDEPL